MPYVLAWKINKDLSGLWFEGKPYETNVIYDICSTDPKMPPVSYSAHTLKPHSITHFDAPSHILKDGKHVNDFYSEKNITPFYGRVLLLKLRGNNWSPSNKAQGIKVWTVGKPELEKEIVRSTGSNKIPNKLILTVSDLPTDSLDHHDSSHALVLDEEAASWLTKNSNFDMFGTSWKSTDFQPGSRERPIHKILMKQAAIFECLDTKQAPEGWYYIFNFPLPLEGASEAPSVPVLFTEIEIKELLKSFEN